MKTLGSGTKKTLARAGIGGLSLASGQIYTLPPGEFLFQPGKYTFLQWYDPVGKHWRNYSGPVGQHVSVVVGDGDNYRLINATGTVVGGLVTNGGTANTAKNGVWPAGSSSVTGVTATTTAGAGAPGGTATFNCIVGGAVSTTVVVTAGGASYARPPILEFSKPAEGGLQATGYAVLTAGVVTSVVITNQGAGYPSAPTINVRNAPGDTTGNGCVLTAALDATNDGKLVAVTMADNGSGYAAVPTITIAGLAGSPAVTAIMCLTVVTATTVTGGTNYSNGAQLTYSAGETAGSGTTVNPDYTTKLYAIRDGKQTRTTTAGATGGVVIDGGLSQVDHSNAGVLAFTSNGIIPGATTFVSGAPGGVIDTSFLIPA